MRIAKDSQYRFGRRKSGIEEKDNGTESRVSGVESKGIGAEGIESIENGRRKKIAFWKITVTLKGQKVAHDETDTSGDEACL